MGSTSRPPDLISHEISAKNLLLGASRFITLWLPADWDIAPGVGGPEVVASHERNDDKWVASGKAWYVLYNRETRWAMEFRIDVGQQRDASKLAGAEPTTVHGHDARVEWRERGRGLVRRRRVTYMVVSYNCPLSERWVRLEFSGRCGEEAFRTLLEYVPYWRCH
jgi:hypothetical protein